MENDKFNPRFIKLYKTIVEQEMGTFAHCEDFKSFFSFEGEPIPEDVVNFIFDGKLLKRSNKKLWPNWKFRNFPDGKRARDYKFKAVLNRLVLRIRNNHDVKERFFEAESLLKHVREKFNDYRYDRDFLDFLVILIKACIYLALEEIIGAHTEPVPECHDPDDFPKSNPFPDGYYRGIGDYSWNLLSAFYRLEITGQNNARGIYVDQQELFHYYAGKNGPAIVGMPQKNLSLADRYFECFDDGKMKKNKDMVNYDFVAWMQHAVDDTPFIDFTRGWDIAAWFALSNPNNANVDAGIYLLDAHENPAVCKRKRVANDKVKYMEQIYLSTKVNPLKSYPINGLKSQGTKVLSFSTLIRVISITIPSFVIIDIPTNDRMKAQKGAFVFFHKALFVDGTPFTAMSSTRLYLQKYKIPASAKSGILAQIKANNHLLNNGYLMEPYDFFK